MHAMHGNILAEKPKNSLKWGLCFKGKHVSGLGFESNDFCQSCDEEEEVKNF